MTNGYTIPMDRLFANQSKYGDMDLQSQQSKEATDRINELARSAFLENMSKPFKQSLLTDFAPAEIENAQLTPNAEPYSALFVRQAPSSIVGGMFSPEISRAAEMEYLQKRQAAMRDRALTFAQLSPMQQADYGFYRGGQQLGDVVGGALGGQDPQLRMIGLQQQILSELDPSDPQQQLMVAQKYAQTAPELAMKIAESARKSMSEIALEKQRTAEKMTPEQRNALAYADTVGARGTPEHTEAFKSRLEQLSVKPEATSTEMKNATALADSVAKRGTQAWNDKYNSELIRLTTKEPKELPPNIKEVGVAEGTRAPVYLDVNNDTQFTYQIGADGKQIRVPYIGGVDRTTAKVSASASSAGETEFSKTLGKADAERVNTALTLRDNSISALTTLQELSKLDEKGLTSGSFASGRVGAANILATVGLISSKDEGILANSQNYQKISGDLVLATLGGRLGAGFSNEDRKFILSLVPQLETNAQARKQLIQFMVKKNQSIIDETTRLEKYARDKKSLEGYVPKIPIFNFETSSLKNISDAELLKQAEEKGIKVKPK